VGHGPMGHGPMGHGPMGHGPMGQEPLVHAPWAHKPCCDGSWAHGPWAHGPMGQVRGNCAIIGTSRIALPPPCVCYMSLRIINTTPLQKDPKQLRTKQKKCKELLRDVQGISKGLLRDFERNVYEDLQGTSKELSRDF